MTQFDDYAKQVAEIAKTYAYRRSNHIPHTGHTVHRLLEAVSKLIGKPVVIQEDRTAAAPVDAC